MPLLRRGAGDDGPGAELGAELGAAGGELGASDELIAFRDEGEQEEEEEEDRRSAAERRDLDDVKSSLVSESETRGSSAEPEAQRRRGGSGSEPDDGAAHRQLLQQALSRQLDRGLLQVAPLLGFPFFMIPDLANICGPYISNGALTASGHTFLPFQWPLLDLPGTSALRETPATHLADASPPPPRRSYSEEFSRQRASPGPSADAGVSRRPHGARCPPPPGGGAHMAHPLSLLLMSGGFSPRLAPPPPPHSSAPAPAAVPAGIKQDPSCSGSRPDGKSPRGAQPVAKEEKRPHIKKPLNAFMLFMREERARVVSECSVKESATINQILGQQWHSLSKEEQAKYYELARKERLLHSKLYPGWSARENYGRKKKRKRMRSHTDTASSAQDFPVQLEKPRPVAGEAPPPPARLARLARRPASRAPSVSHLTHTQLSQASPTPSLDSPATPSAALASPAAPAPTRTHSPPGRASPCGEQLQPLSLTTKPPRTFAPLGPAASPAAGTPPPPRPPLFLAPPPTSTHQSAGSCHGALTLPQTARGAAQQ